MVVAHCSTFIMLFLPLLLTPCPLSPASFTSTSMHSAADWRWQDAHDDGRDPSVRLCHLP